MLILLLITASTIYAQELPCKSYSSSSRCLERYKEDKDGNKHGKYISYDYSGNVKESGVYVHGLKQGNWKVPTGILNEYRYEWYEKGKFISHSEEYVKTLKEALEILKARQKKFDDAYAARLAKHEEQRKADEEKERQAAIEANRAEERRMEAEARRIAQEKAEQDAIKLKLSKLPIKKLAVENTQSIGSVTLTEVISGNKKMLVLGETPIFKGTDIYSMLKRYNSAYDLLSDLKLAGFKDKDIEYINEKELDKWFVTEPLTTPYIESEKARFEFYFIVNSKLKFRDAQNVPLSYFFDYMDGGPIHTHVLIHRHVAMVIKPKSDRL